MFKVKFIAVKLAELLVSCPTWIELFVAKYKQVDIEFKPKPVIPHWMLPELIGKSLGRLI